MGCKIQFIENRVLIDVPNEIYSSSLGSEIIDLVECNEDTIDGIVKEPYNSSAGMMIHGIYGDVIPQETLEEIRQTAAMVKEYVSIFLDESPVVDEYKDMLPLDRYLRLSIFNDVFIKCNISFDKDTKKIIETYIPESFKEACYIIFIKMIQHNITIKKCKNCGKYFLKRAGYNNEYCNRLIPGKESKTCRDLGAIINYRINSKDDYQKLFEKAYKKISPFCKRNKLRNEFYRWYHKASLLRDESRSKKIPVNEYEEKLKEIEEKQVYSVNRQRKIEEE